MQDPATKYFMQTIFGAWGIISRDSEIQKNLLCSHPYVSIYREQIQPLEMKAKAKVKSVKRAFLRIFLVSIQRWCWVGAEHLAGGPCIGSEASDASAEHTPHLKSQLSSPAGCTTAI